MTNEFSQNRHADHIEWNYSSDDDDDDEDDGDNEGDICPAEAYPFHCGNNH